MILVDAEIVSPVIEVDAEIVGVQVNLTHINVSQLPTSDAGLLAGEIWYNGTTVEII